MGENTLYKRLGLNVGDEPLHLDVDEFLKVVELTQGDETTEPGINLPKFEFFKLMVDTICGLPEDVDDGLGNFGLNKLSVPYKIAFNTLIKYKILKN